MNYKARLSCCFTTAAIIILASSVAGAQTRVYFARGATRATVRGYLRGMRDEANFVLRAKAGQHMRVDIRARGATRGTVTFPSGQGDGQPGGVIFDGILPETGDYGIRVTESSMANAWRGSFTIVIDITSAGSDERPAADNRDLSRYAGRYPSDLFRHEPALKTRLRALLGANYRFFFDRLQTEVPIENDGGVLIVRGCMAHQCTIEEAILAIDLTDGRPYAAIKSTRYEGGFKLFPPDKSRLPDALRRAMRE